MKKTMNNYSTIFEAVGGVEGIKRIVQAFYPKVLKNPLIGPLFPADIDPVMERQTLFLSQFFGGPSLYSDQHGHPMMRARHMPFPITPERAEAWLGCMRAALAETDLPAELQELILDRLSGPAHHFINQP